MNDFPAQDTQKIIKILHHIQNHNRIIGTRHFSRMKIIHNKFFSNIWMIPKKKVRQKNSSSYQQKSKFHESFLMTSSETITFLKSIRIFQVQSRQSRVHKSSHFTYPREKLDFIAGFIRKKLYSSFHFSQM